NSFTRPTTRPKRERGNAYPEPNHLARLIPLGTFESFDCRPSGGEQPNPDDQVNNPNPFTKSAAKSPPCFVEPPSLYDGKLFQRLPRGEVPDVSAPRGTESTEGPPNPNR
ncbi:MAG: hypothetical protein WKF29_09315, partial [Thermoleophilaceae bacterium]